MTTSFQMFLLSAAAAASAAQPLSRQTLHTPDAIAPAALPYLACLYAERGLPLLRGADGTQVSYDKSKSDCSAARERAKADAARLLQGKTVPGGVSAAAYIDEALADMDQYVASLPIGGSAKEAVIGIPVTIEDEVQPMYARYDDCLKTQVSERPISADTILAKFREAMASCSSVRAYAVTEAAKALVTKGWDEPTRQRAAESTFAKIDESWLAMGQQYRAMLLEKGTAATKPTAKPATDGKHQ